MYQSISRYSKPCHSSCSQGLIEDSGLAWATRLHWWIIRGLVVPCGWCAYASIRPLEAECLRSPHLLSGTGFGRQQALIPGRRECCTPSCSTRKTPRDWRANWETSSPKQREPGFPVLERSVLRVIFFRIPLRPAPDSDLIGVLDSLEDPSDSTLVGR
jgi:hypothetical protein